MDFVNLTPYIIDLTGENSHIGFPSDGHAQLIAHKEQINALSAYNIPLYHITYEIQGLPDPKPYTSYIVLPEVSRVAHRPDVLTLDNLTLKNFVGQIYATGELIQECVQ